MCLCLVDHPFYVNETQTRPPGAITAIIAAFGILDNGRCHRRSTVDKRIGRPELITTEDANPPSIRIKNSAPQNVGQSVLMGERPLMTIAVSE